LYDLDNNIIGWQNHALLGQILNRHARRMSFSDVYGEEARIIQIETVDMTPDVREKYDLFHDQSMLELSECSKSRGGRNPQPLMPRGAA